MLRKWMICGIAVLGITLAFGASAIAAPVTLVDDNSSATVDPTLQSGMDDWTVDGVSQLFQQWFWYRTGAQEESIDTLNLAAVVATDTNGDGDNDSLFLNYTGTGFELSVQYILTGGQAGSGVSDIAEIIRIHNTGNSALPISFFQYSDFDLGGDDSDDVAVLVAGGQGVRQTDPGTTFSETVVTPAADHWEIAEFSDTLDKLNDGDADNLSDSTSPAGPADLTWAFQWDFNIPVDGTVIISKDKQVSPVPVPGAALLGVIGLGLVGWMRRRLG